ncbi:hypothetical protein [Propionispora vibrioides]|nr:hypothetical protein [Propionispora vibrioides]
MFHGKIGMKRLTCPLFHIDKESWEFFRLGTMQLIVALVLSFLPW